MPMSKASRSGLEPMNRRPNKAPEPTTMAVTPPAAQESRQPWSWLILNVRQKPRIMAKYNHCPNCKNTDEGDDILRCTECNLIHCDACGRTGCQECGRARDPLG